MFKHSCMALALGCVGAAASAATAAPDLRIAACTQPLVVSIRRAETATQPATSLTTAICSLPHGGVLHSDDPQVPSMLRADLTPGLTFTMTRGKQTRSGNDIDLNLHLGIQAQALQTLQVDGADVAVAWSGRGPPWRVRLDSDRSRNLQRGFITMATDVPVQRIAGELAAAGGFTVTGLTALGDARANLDFRTPVPALQQFQLLAEIGGINVQQVGERSVHFGQARDLQAIVALLNAMPVDDREPALKHVVALAKPNDTEDLELFPTDELMELADIAAARKDAAQARACWSTLLSQSAQREGKHEPEVDTPEHAQLLIGLAAMEFEIGDRAQVARLLQRAEAILEARDGVFAVDLIDVLALRARMQLPQSPEQAAALLERAVDIADHRAVASDRLYLLLWRLSEAHTFAKDWARAEGPLRRLLVHHDSNPDGETLVLEHYARILDVQHKYEQSALYWQKLLALIRPRYRNIASATRTEGDEARTLAYTLQRLALTALFQGKPAAAIPYWSQMRELRAELLGTTHARTRAADIELAALARMHTKTPGQNTGDAGPRDASIAHPLGSGSDPHVDRLPYLLQRVLKQDLLAEWMQESLIREVGELSLATTPTMALAVRLEWLAEARLAVDGERSLDRAVADYASAMKIRVRHEPDSALTHPAAARLAALQQLAASRAPLPR